MQLTVYRQATGEVLYTQTTRIEPTLSAGKAYIVGLYPGHEYFIAEELPVLRPSMMCSIDKTDVAADENDFCTINGMPNPCRVSVFGPGVELSVLATGGTETLTFDHPGEYLVTISEFPFLEKEYQVNAN